LARPVHRAAGAGNPAGSNGAKSKGVAVDMIFTPVLFFVERVFRPSCRLVLAGWFLQASS
jgi:hypothetical protein